MGEPTTEIAPGVYEVRGNGEYHVRALRGLINRGGADCTAHVYRHDGGGTAGPRGRQVCEFTLTPGHTRMAPQGWLPPEEPLIVEILDFVEGAPPTQAAGEPVPTIPDSLGLPPAASPVVTPRAFAARFPGFVITCGRCRSGTVSLTSLPGKSYLECEDCGAMCRLCLEA